MRFWFVTLGCPKNEVDSEMMAQVLRQAGHVEAPSERQADVLIVNTCGFVQAAREESYGALRELAQSRRRGQLLVAAGCMAQRYGERLYAEVPGLDAVIGTQSWPDIGRLLQSLTSRQQARGPGGQRDRWSIVATGGDLVASTPRTARGPSAYVKIADGCSASCAFCAIPLIKGPQQSKPREEIVREAQELHEAGVREVVLIAQNSTAYGRDLGLDDALPGLVEEVAAATPDLDWIRIMYAYPQNITPRLLEVMARLPQVCHYIDLPLQHGHPDVLRRMNRPHDVEAILRLIESLRQAIPDIALRSAFIVGYPGETDDEFEELLAFMSAISFDRVGVFAYSAEEGTSAATLPNHVPAEVAAVRYDRAMRHQQAISLARNGAQVGREIDVLVEGVGEGLCVGRSYRDAPEVDGVVLVPAEIEPGEMVRVRIVAAQEYDVVGEPIVAGPADRRAAGRGSVRRRRR